VLYVHLNENWFIAKMLLKLSVLFLCMGLVLSAYHKRHRHLEKINFVELCIDKGPNEFFRINEEHDCNEVFQCSEKGLLPLRCPSNLAFDIEKQICDWTRNVKNCKQLQKSKIKLSEFAYERTICPSGQTGCISKECIDTELFCDGVVHCRDGSDETMCSADQDPNFAPKCNKTTCKLPECYCSENGDSIPNDLPRESVPQMIMITFDDAVNNNNIDIYDELFAAGRNNPNGCSIKGTLFLSHKYTNYSAVQDLHRRGHEIAVHSITHNSDESYWANGTVDQWSKEMAGARLIVERFANITDNSVVGMRVPLLKVGGNNQFKMMENQGFLYDSSMGVPLSSRPKYPYTLHHRMPHQCHGNFQKCPTRSASVWEIPMNEYDRRENPEDGSELSGCVMVDQCSNLVSGQLFYNFLEHNFNRHFDSNRAPLGLYFHASWLLNRVFLDTLIDWIDEKLEMKSVYFTTMTQVIRWMQNPTPLNQINQFEPFLQKCDVQGPPSCYHPNQCALTNRDLPGETIRLHTCLPCEGIDVYPWINQPTGEFLIPDVAVVAAEANITFPDPL